MDRNANGAKLISVRNPVHPSVEDVTVEAILHALSDPIRVAIFAQIAGSGRAQTCSDFRHMCEQDVPKSTLSQHFKVLRESGLIRSERHGVEMRNTARDRELEGRFPGLIPSILGALRVQSSGRRPGGRVAAPDGPVGPGRSRIAPAGRWNR